MKYAQSIKPNAEEAVLEIKNQLESEDVSTILYFVSSAYNQDKVATAMNAAFPDIVTFGCSTSGEIISGQMLKNSIVAMAFHKNVIGNYSLQVVENISSEINFNNSISAFEKEFNVSFDTMDMNEYVGLILIDGLSGKEEAIMDTLGTKTNVLFVGASAGDDLKFKKTFIHANGKVYSDACLLFLMKPETKYEIIKTQSFTILDEQLTATKVNPEAREVCEFNGVSAKEAYAKALDIDVKEISDRFMRNPIGIIIDEEPFVRSPQQVTENGIKFYCNVLEGMELHLLETGDIVKDTETIIKQKEKELGGISAIINFNCILRTLELEKENKTEEYGKVFSDYPTIGFSTYGEQYLGHINQTATMLLFK